MLRVRQQEFNRASAILTSATSICCKGARIAMINGQKVFDADSHIHASIEAFGPYLGEA
jgi:hypothetical protein